MRKYVPLFMGIAFFLASLNLRPAINAVSPLLQALSRDLGMSALTASLLTSIPVLCMGIFSPIAVKLGHRLGMERVIGWSLAVIGVGNVLRLAAGSAPVLLVTAFVAGVGIATIGPLLSGFIKKWFPAHVPTMISLYAIALAVGATLASGLTIPLQARLHSWQAALAVWAVLAVVALPVWWLAVSRRAGRPAAAAANGAQRAAGLPWGDRRAWLLTISFGLLAMLFYSITAWLPPIVQNMGYSKQYAGNMLTVFSIIQIPVSLALPALLKRYPSRRFWLLLGSSLLLTGFVLLAFAVRPWLAAILIGLGPGVLFPINLLLPIDEAADAQQAAAWSAMTQSIGYVIGALGPVLLGAVHDAAGGSFALLIVAMLIVNVAMMGVHLAVAKRRRVKPLAAASA